MVEKLKKTRLGFSLVELLIAVVVLGILGAMLIAAGTASQNRARVAVAQNDIDSVKNAVYQALMLHPEVMQMTDSAANNAKIITYISNEMDEDWQLYMCNTSNTSESTDTAKAPIAAETGCWTTTTNMVASSGAVAQTLNHMDPWGNPYGVYIYTDTMTKEYNDAAGTALDAADSCCYIVICSAGTNGTGGPMGISGDAKTNPSVNNWLDPAKMINNTDGIDDLGVIIRILNGSTTMATFGWDNATLGTLKNYQWVFGKVGTDAKGGTYTRNSSGNMTTASYAKSGSIDQYPDLKTLEVSVTGAGIKEVGQLGG